MLIEANKTLLMVAKTSLNSSSNLVTIYSTRICRQDRWTPSISREDLMSFTSLTSRYVSISNWAYTDIKASVTSHLRQLTAGTSLSLSIQLLVSLMKTFWKIQAGPGRPCEKLELKEPKSWLWSPQGNGLNISKVIFPPAQGYDPQPYSTWFAL
jgi:hypothetical protein